MLLRSLRLTNFARRSLFTRKCNLYTRWTQIPTVRVTACTNLIPYKYQIPTVQRRYYSEVVKLTVDDIQKRVLKVVKGFDKIDPDKVTETSSFQKDLGIDSLDTVELVMAVEEEFVIEIPDADSEKLQGVADVINYIALHPHAK